MQLHAEGVTRHASSTDAGLSPAASGHAPFPRALGWLAALMLMIAAFGATAPASHAEALTAGSSVLRDLSEYAKSLDVVKVTDRSRTRVRSWRTETTDADGEKTQEEIATYIGWRKCVECHTNQHETFSKTLMGMILLKKPRDSQEALGCEACHGPGSKHAAKGGVKDEGDPGGLIAFSETSPRPASERNAACLSCHENGQRTHWRGSEHETRGLACTQCHQIMEQASPKFMLKQANVMDTCFQCHKDRKAQLFRTSHMPYREGKLVCTDCHNPHGSENEKLLKQATVNETCYQCHAEKRGPFLWEHVPVRENCANCHEPHGSVNQSLLKVTAPRLCQQCHTQDIGNHPSVPHNPNVVFAFNRGCVNCHGAIHGSNHVSGNLFHR